MIQFIAGVVIVAFFLVAGIITGRRMFGPGD